MTVRYFEDYAVGQTFIESISPDGFDFFSPQGYDKIYREGKKSL